MTASPERALIFALCAAFSWPATAAEEPERWLVAKASDGAMGYDANSIERNAKSGIVTVMIATHVSAPLKSPTGIEWQYMVWDSSLDCKNDKVQVSGMVLFSPAQQMADVQEREGQPWQPIAGNSVIEIVRDVVCKGHALSEAREAATFEAAMNLMKTMAK